MLFRRTLSAAFAAALVVAAPSVWAQAEGELPLELDFETADTDGDARLSNEEVTTVVVTSLTEFFKDHGDQAEALAEQCAPQIVEQLFAEADKDGDGFLTQEELEAVAQ